MKKSLLLFITIYYGLLIADSSFYSDYRSYNYFSTFESQFSWNYLINHNYSLLLNTNYNNSMNSTFNRSSRNVNYYYYLSYNKFKLKPYIVYENENLHNSGLPIDDILIYNKKYHKTGIGYITTFLNHNLILEQNSYHIKLSRAKEDYFGWNSKSKIMYTDKREKYNISTSYNFDLQDIYLDKNLNHNFDFNFFFNNINKFNTVFKYNNNSKDIYSFNYFEDKSNRAEYIGGLFFSSFLTDVFEWVFNNKIHYRSIDYRNKTRRNSWSFENDIYSLINYSLDNSVYFTKINLKNTERVIKNMSFNQENHIFNTEEKIFSYGGYWNKPYIDTLRIEITHYITENIHSNTLKTMDNDIVMSIYEINFTHHFFEHRFFNTVKVYQGEQAYIHHSLSAYNHKKISYLWNPEVDLKISDYFSLINKYEISADYQYYTWKSFISDRFYRRWVSEWGALLNTSNHFQSYNYLPKSNYMKIYCAFILENIETAEKNDNSWLLSNSEIIRQYLLKFDYEYKKLNFQLQPTIKHFKHVYESEILASVFLKLNNFQFFTSINPIGKQLNKMIWKYNININCNF